VWSRDGRHLYYRGSDGIMEVACSTSSAAFNIEKPHLWAKATPAQMRWFDLAPDGKRFIVVQDDVETRETATPVTFVLNFFDELRRRVPTR
jgi:hypothetical protein